MIAYVADLLGPLLPAALLLLGWTVGMVAWSVWPGKVSAFRDPEREQERVRWRKGKLRLVGTRAARRQK